MPMAPASDIPAYLSTATAAVLGPLLHFANRRASREHAGRQLGLEFIAVAAVSLAVGWCATAYAQSAEEAPASTTTPAEAPPQSDGSSYCGRRLGAWFYCEPPVAEAAPATSDQRTKAVVPPEIIELEAYQKALEEAGRIAS